MRNYKQDHLTFAEELAIAFLDRYSINELIYQYENTSWYFHNNYGGLWQEDPKRVQCELRELAHTLIAGKKPRDRKRLTNQFIKGSRLAEAYEFAIQMRYKEQMYRDREFNTETDLVGIRGGVLQGVVSLREREFRDAYPCEYQTEGIEHDVALNFDDVDETPSCPNFVSLLDHITENDETKVDYLLSFFGLAITGEIDGSHTFLFIQGAPGTGKSTLVQIIQKVFGTYQHNLESTRLQLGGNQDHSTWLFALRNKRLVTVTETSKKLKRWNTTLINRLCDGSMFSARGMRQDETEFRSQAKLIIEANHLPKFDPEDGFARRVIHVPVNQKPDVIDKDLSSKLEREIPAILMLICQYGMRYYEQGLPPVPEDYQYATDKYLSAQNTVGQFLTDCNVERIDSLLSGERILVKTLYERYSEYCDDKGIESSSKLAFNAELESQGFIKKPGAKNRFEWQNLSMDGLSG